MEVSFTAAGPVRGLIITPGVHKIAVNWKKPDINSYCVTHYNVSWKYVLNGIEKYKFVSLKNDYFVIDDIEACLDYEVGVAAVNEDLDFRYTKLRSTTTQTDGNYQTYYFVIFITWVRLYEKVMAIPNMTEWIFNF
jgi:hypothetical protein